MTSKQELRKKKQKKSDPTTRQFQSFLLIEAAALSFQQAPEECQSRRLEMDQKQSNVSIILLPSNTGVSYAIPCREICMFSLCISLLNYTTQGKVQTGLFIYSTEGMHRDCCNFAQGLLFCTGEIFSDGSLALSQGICMEENECTQGNSYDVLVCN